MKENKKCKFDFVAFLAVLILIAFIGCMCVAIAFGIKQQKNLFNVAFADSTNGVVENNIFTNPTLSNTGSSSSYSGTITNFIDDWNLAYGTVSWTNSVFTHTNSTSTWQGIWHQLQFTGGDTYTFSVYGYSSSTLRIYAYNYVSGGRAVLSNASHSNSSSTLLSITFTCPLDATDIRLFIYGAESSSVYYIEWAKLEKSSSFTGYVPKDYENYGYNQGYTEGLDNNIDMRNYIRVGSLDYNSRQVHSFTLDSIDYGISNYIEDSDSIYGYHNPDFAQIIPDEGEAIGCKFSSDLLFGDILITFPYVLDTSSGAFNYSILLIDTVDGTRLYSTVNDTLHWQYSNHLGNINNSVSMSVDYYIFHFFASHVVDIYFICIGSTVNSAYTWYPLDDPSFAVYSTQSLTSLSSFDEGFQQGLKEGADSAVQGNAQAVANARAEGYERGRRDALSDGNDYSFMGLLGAVFDAPIKSFQGLLNFYVLGVNMQSFVLALLSLSVIIIIIKIALGGK